MLPLQFLTEALVGLCLEEAQEGNMQGRLPLSLHAKSRPNVISLLEEATYLVCGGVYGHIYKEYVAEHPPGLVLFFRYLPACDRLHPLIGQQEAGVYEVGECAASQDGVPPPCQECGLSSRRRQHVGTQKDVDGVSHAVWVL